MEEFDPDDPARQDEVARRLIAYAEKLRAEGDPDQGAEEQTNTE